MMETEIKRVEVLGMGLMATDYVGGLGARAVDCRSSVRA